MKLNMSSCRPTELAENMQKCSHYQSVLLQKAETDMELRRRKRNIRKLSVEIGNLSLEVERAKLEEKWGTKRPGDKKSPAEETLRLCKQLEEEPDELDSILQELCTHQSKVTSQVTDLRAQLAALTTG